ncbi:MAG: hypothetical protein HGA23_06060, partial [Bacteroidales bacterium]|nr:hypothetical protein [Bacteroidales bacterium]
ADDQLFATDEDRVYRLEASGEWTDITPTVTYELFGSVNAMNDTVFLSVEYDDPYDAPFILFSANNGNNWQNLVNPVPSAGDDPYRIYCDNHTLYVFEDDFMYYTSNLGSNWTSLGLPSQFCNSFTDFLVYNSVPFATAFCCGQALKLDYYQGWILSNNGLPTNRSPEDLVWCDGALFVYM